VTRLSHNFAAEDIRRCDLQGKKQKTKKKKKEAHETISWKIIGNKIERGIPRETLGGQVFADLHT